MKKKVFGRQLSRERDTRRALIRSLARALVINGKIVTTKAKAKAIQGYVEKLVTLGKTGGIPARRKLYAVLANDRTIVDFIVERVAPAFNAKKSGFTRIINLPRRLGDNAQMVRFEWTEEVEKFAKKEKTKDKKKKADKKEDDKKEKGKKGKSGLKGKVKADKKTETKRTLKNILKKKK